VANGLTSSGARDDCTIQDVGDFEAIAADDDRYRSLLTPTFATAFDAGDREDEVLGHRGRF